MSLNFSNIELILNIVYVTIFEIQVLLQIILVGVKVLALPALQCNQD